MNEKNLRRFVKHVRKAGVTHPLGIIDDDLHAGAHEAYNHFGEVAIELGAAFPECVLYNPVYGHSSEKLWICQKEACNTQELAVKLFGITPQHAEGLFKPNAQVSLLGCEYDNLDEFCTLEQWVGLIETYIKHQNYGHP